MVEMMWAFSGFFGITYIYNRNGNPSPLKSHFTIHMTYIVTTIVLALFIATYIYVITLYGSSILIHNPNNRIVPLLWVASIVLSYMYRSLYPLLLPVFAIILNELSYTQLNRDLLFQGQNRTQVFYDLGTQHFIRSESGTENFTEAVYLDHYGRDLDISQAKQIAPLDAQRRRFQEIFRVLGIEGLSHEERKSLRLVDFGCGNGEFVQFCQGQGLAALGITISREQAKYVESKGIPCRTGNYHEYQADLKGTVDFITFIGCLEHITYGVPCHGKTLERQHKNWGQLLDNCRSYFRPESRHKKIYNTTLHLNPKYCGTREMYLLERAYGGAYSFQNSGNRLSDQATRHGYRTVYERDMTYHYYLSSVLDPNHFGNPAKLSTQRMLMALPATVFINPQVMNILVYGHYGIWMWQFDGKLHTFSSSSGNVPGFQKSRVERPTTLWWSVLQVK